MIPKAAEIPKMIKRAPAAPENIRIASNFIDMKAAIKKVFCLN